MFRCLAIRSISARVTQMYPSPGPEQQSPHPVHSKCKPAAYHFVPGFVLLIAVPRLGYHFRTAPVSALVAMTAYLAR